LTLSHEIAFTPRDRTGNNVKEVVSATIMKARWKHDLGYDNNIGSGELCKKLFHYTY